MSGGSTVVDERGESSSEAFRLRPCWPSVPYEGFRIDGTPAKRTVEGEKAIPVTLGACGKGGSSKPRPVTTGCRWMEGDAAVEVFVVTYCPGRLDEEEELSAGCA